MSSKVLVEPVPPFSSGRFEPGPQDFGEAPGLGDATAGVVRFPRIEYFTDGSDSSIVQMIWEALEKFSRRRMIMRMDLEPGVNERTNQPRPDRALMISAVAGAEVAAINRFVGWIIRGKRSKPDRR